MFNEVHVIINMQFKKFFNPFLKNENIKTCVLSMKARSGQNHDNKIAPQVNFNPTAANIMDILLFLSSLNNTFFSVLVIIFSNKSYFCFNYTNTFFIHAMNYFSVVLRIIFLMYIKNYFLIGPRIIFRGIANLFFGLQCIAGLAFEVDWFEFFTSLGDHFENFASGGVLSKRMPRRNIVRERNERGFHLSYKICQELVVCR